MTYESIDNYLNDAEEIVEVSITSQVSGATYPKARAYKNNTLGQVLEGYAEDIGVSPADDKILFINKRTQKSTSDKNMTIEAFDLCNGDVLVLGDDAKVAGVSTEENDMENTTEDIVEIVITSQVSGATYPKVRAYKDNTLGQVLEGYAEDIGVSPIDDKILFINKRTQKSTNDRNMSIEDFDLYTGDVLVIGDDSRVAGCSGSGGHENPA